MSPTALAVSHRDAICLLLFLKDAVYHQHYHSFNLLYPLTDEWIKQLWYIYTMEYYLAIKRNEFESVVLSWMNLEPLIQSEISQKENNKYYILIHIYGIQKNGTDEPSREQAHGHSRGRGRWDQLRK